MRPELPGALTAIRPLLSLLSPAGERARLSILIFHRVMPEPDPLQPGDPDAERFRWQMRLLAQHFRVLPLIEAVEQLRDGRLPARAAAVTFDDGYADNVTVALPILREAGVPATFFIATGYLDGGRMFNDTVIETVRQLPVGEDIDLSEEGLGKRSVRTEADRRALCGELIGSMKYAEANERNERAERLARRLGARPPTDLMMTSDQLRRLSDAGMEIGAHTHNHPILARVDRAKAEREMRENKSLLEDATGRSVRLFAYPNGLPGKDYLPEHVSLAKTCGFEAAFSTVGGAACRDSDRFELPRFTPWDRTPLRFGLRLAENLRRRPYR